MIPLLRKLLHIRTDPVPPKGPKGRQGLKKSPPQAGSLAPPVTPVRHYFEALNTVDHRTPIPATGLHVHRLLTKFNRLQLASVARYLWDNVGLVFYATDLVANYSTPMIPRAATLDRKWNEAANSLFDDWAERADFTGRFDFWDLQRLGSFYLDTDGEVFALWTDEAGFPQIQLFEAWRIDKPTAADDRIFDGIQLDTQGRVLGYWLDGQTFLDANTLIHLFDLERYTQYRGMSPIRRGANDMRDGNDIKGFQKVLSKLSTALTLAIQGAPLEENPWGNPPEPAGEVSTEEEAPAETNAKQRSFTVADLIAGDIPTVPEGHELKQVNTPSAPANNIEVISYLAGCFVAGLGLPPAFFLHEKLTGTNQRAVNGKAQRKFDRRKQVAARLGRSAWQRVIASAITSGALPSTDGWARCDFIGPSKITIDAGREMAQEREDVARGLMSRRDHYGNRGRSWRQETDQVFEPRKPTVAWVGGHDVQLGLLDRLAGLGGRVHSERHGRQHWGLRFRGGLPPDAGECRDRGSGLHQPGGDVQGGGDARRTRHRGSRGRVHPPGAAHLRCVPSRRSTGPRRRSR
ncbi:MAG TPA: phage portal protein [Verrucomicrobiota bacterium]|nr:phage portal protein [Verrucomicrobiota bacterium]